jgi:hypothetical protein
MYDKTTIAATTAAGTGVLAMTGPTTWVLVVAGICFALGAILVTTRILMNRRVRP